jgi:hypothetical protein
MEIEEVIEKLLDEEKQALTDAINGDIRAVDYLKGKVSEWKNYD